MGFAEEEDYVFWGIVGKLWGGVVGELWSEGGGFGLLLWEDVDVGFGVYE
jgi:hypothetical protein